MHTVRVVTVLTTRRQVELVALFVLEAAVLWWSSWRWQSVVVPQPVTGRVHLTEIRNYLHLTVSPSPSPVHFTFAFSVFACTSHKSPCVMSSLIPPPLHAHVPYCTLLLWGPGSDSSPSSEFGPRLRLLLSLEPQLQLPKTPRSRCFPLLRIYVFIRELNIHHSNSISIYNKTIYHQT